MSTNIGQLASDLYKAMSESDNKKPKPYDTQAEVVRVEGDTAYIHIPGGVDETPAQITTNVKPGDMVRARLSGGRAWILGNSTSPPTDDTTANNALAKAGKVEETVVQLNTYVVTEIEADRATIKELESDTAKIHDLTADQLQATVGYIDDLTAGSINASDIIADHADVGTLKTSKADISDLQAERARIDDLEADHVSTSDLQATNAEITNLKSSKADVTDLQATNAKVTNLESTKADISDLNAANAKITNLESTKADISDLNAANAKITNLESTKADITFLESNYAEIDLANVNNAYIKNGAFDTAAIVDEQVFTVTGNKATIKEINADEINVRNLNAKNLKIETADGYIQLGDKKTPTKEFIDSLTDELNDRIDGAIETYTSTAIPTLSNYPANDWETDDEKATHVGDVCYVVNDQIAQNGYCYRFTLSGSTFSWQLIKDSDVTAALRRLQTAEGKIEGIESFDEEIASFKTDTEDELSSLKTKTTSLETSLGDKVDKSTFNEVKQTVDENSSTITTLSETTTTLREDLDNLEIGGRNLIRGTSYDNVYTASLNVDDDYYIDFCTSSIQRIEGETEYTLSFDAKANVDGAKITSYWYAPNTTTYSATNVNPSWRWAGSDGNTTIELTTEWKRYWIRWQQSDSEGTAKSLIIARLFPPTSGSVTVEVRRPKFEAGTIPTDWTPAPEDVEESISTVSNTVNEVKQTADGNSASIRSLTQTVESKADGSTVSTLSQTVNDVKQTATSNSSTISSLTTTLGTNADGTSKTGDIVHKMSAVEQDLSGFKTTVSETYHKTSDFNAFKSANDQAVAAAKKAGTDAQSDLDAYKGTVDETYATKSSVTQTAESIKSEVSETYATKTSLDELSIGGRNILLNTAVSSSNLSKIGADPSCVSFVTEDEIPCYKVTNYTATHLFDNTWQYGCMAEKLRANTTYTYSAYVKISGFSSPFTFYSFGHFNVSNPDGYAPDPTHEDVVSKRIYSPSNIEADTWTKISITFTTNELDGSSFGVFPIYDTGGNTMLYMRDFKLEKGNKATDWTPAPEDLEAATDAVRSDLDAYKTTVAETYATNASVTQTSDSIKQEVASTYTKSETFNAYKTSNDQAVADAKKAGTDAQSAIDGFEIGGKNLLIGSSKFREDTPIVHTSPYSDGYTYIDVMWTDIKVHTGEKYAFQAKSDGTWADHHGDNPTTAVLPWLVFGYDKLGHNNYMPLIATHTRNGDGVLYLDDGKWSIIIPEWADNQYVSVRVNNYGGTSSEPVTHSYWDFKLEKGSKPTDWTATPEETEESTVQAALGKVAVGGRNLLYKNFDAGQNTQAASEDYALILPATSAGDTYFWLYTHTPLVKGEMYTLSVEVSGLLEGTQYPWYCLDFVPKTTPLNFSVDKNGLVSATFTQETDTKTSTVTHDGKELYGYLLDDSGTTLASGQGPITLRHFKLEKGSVATDWTRAPEDTEAEIASIKTDYVTNASWNVEKEALEGQVSAVETTTKAYTDGKITTEVDDRNAAINAKANEINLGVSRTYTTKESFNSLAIGGNNLWSCKKNYDLRVGNAGVMDSIDDGGLTMTATGRDMYTNGIITTTGGSYYSVMGQLFELDPDSDYILTLTNTDYDNSYITYIDENYKCIAYAGFDTTGVSPSQIDANGAHWIRKAESHLAGAKYFIVRIGVVEPVVGETYKTKIKIETGNKPTAWSPAQDDLNDYTDSAVNSAKAEIKVTTDGISGEVAKKVGSSEIISKINQSAESIQISASKVEIDGEVTFNAIKDKIEVGGRNLIHGTSSDGVYTGTLTVDGAYYNDFCAFSIQRIEGETEYTLSFDAKTDIDGFYICSHWYSPNTTTHVSTSDNPIWREANTDGYVATILTTEWKRYWIKWRQSDSEGTLKNLIVARMFRPSSGSVTVEVRRPKFEVGIIPSEWTPAPEDVAATATDYITKIDDAGIAVHPSGTTDNRVAINADGMEVFKGNTSVAMYGDESRVGDADGYHTRMTDSSIELNKADNTMFQVMATGETVNVKNTQMLLKAGKPSSGTSRSTTVILNPNVTYSFSMYASPAVGVTYSFTTSSASTTSQTATSDDGNFTLTVSYVRQYETVNGTSRIAHVKATIRETRKTTSLTYPTVGYAYTSDIDESSIHFFGTNNVLWSGAYYMAATHTASLSESVSSQLNGIVLAWSYYNKTTKQGENHDWHYTFIPKQHIFAAGGTGINCGLWGMDAYFGAAATKYVYVSNDEITGYENNDKSGTGTSGIKYDNTQFVLRYVLGV